MAKAKPTYKELVERQLECCVCLDTVRDPQTLQGCFHSVCSPCLEQLLGKEQNLEAGVTCPLCRTFSRRDNIRANFFIKGLVDIHVSHTEKRMCEQCPDSAEPTEASCKCLDCKMHMCTTCKDSHLKIKLLQGHRILPLTEATELIVDQLVFCSHHPDKPIELYCEPCQRPVCMMCTVIDHSGHKCQTIQATLDKMVPWWENNIKYIEDKLQAVTRSSVEVDKKIEETKSEFKKCIVHIDKKAEERIAQIQATQNRMKEDLKTKEQEEIEKLEKVKRDLDEKRRDGENVRRVVRTSLDRARHASLLTELTQEGLGSKYDTVKEWVETTVDSLDALMPSFEDGDAAWEKSKGGILGNVVYHSFKSIRTWNVDVKDYLTKQFKQVVQINLNKQCFRITPIKEDIWVPQYKSGVEIYNKIGVLKNTVIINHPISIAEANNGDIFIACSNTSGLYVTTASDPIPELISVGSFTDVYAFGDKMYALDYGKNMIREYVCNAKDANSLTLRWQAVKSIPITDIQELDTFLVHKSKSNDSTEYFVCVREQKCIYTYNQEGKCIHQYTKKLRNPYICGIDKNSNIIVACNTDFKALNIDNDKPAVLNRLCDAYLYLDVRLDKDGSVWINYRNADKQNIILRYELV